MMKKQAILAFLLALASGVVYAHAGHESTKGYSALVQGFLHPLSGVDHLLMMLAVGLWAAKLEQAAYWKLPMTFLSFMVIGMLLGASGFYLSWMEYGIALGVLVLGLLLLIGSMRNLQFAIAVTAIFASFHGLAHGVEMQETQGFAALTGVLVATALLQMLGLFLGKLTGGVFLSLQKIYALFMVMIGSFLLFA
jgi:urease accessory protein